MSSVGYNVGPFGKPCGLRCTRTKRPHRTTITSTEHPLCTVGLISQRINSATRPVPSHGAQRNRNRCTSTLVLCERSVAVLNTVRRRTDGLPKGGFPDLTSDTVRLLAPDWYGRTRALDSREPFRGRHLAEALCRSCSLKSRAMNQDGIAGRNLGKRTA